MTCVLQRVDGLVKKKWSNERGDRPQDRVSPMFILDPSELRAKEVAAGVELKSRGCDLRSL